MQPGDERSKVAVADANPHMRRITEGFLRASTDWELKTVETVDQLFTDICFWEPKIVICAERLADGTVFDLLRKCREAGESLPAFGLIVTLSRPGRDTVLALRAAGCPIVLRSPFSRSELDARMAYVLHHLEKRGTLMSFQTPANAGMNAPEEAPGLLQALRAWS